MNELRFDGRVAVVTGAGRGIGRAYALLLAERGASVVVNDLGGTKEGDGSDPEPSRHVATEIELAGGRALADANDVASEEGARSLIASALDTFGRVDIVVNNAGNIRWGGLPEADLDNLDSHLAVHVHGSFNTIRAAWPGMVDQGYGRLVLTTSTGIFGLTDNLGYATAKAALIGMAQSLSAAGALRGIKVNLIAPNASTRMGAHPSDGLDVLDRPASALMEPDLVAPMATYLAHEACQVTGRIYLGGAGRFARIFLGVTEGYVSSTEHPTMEEVAANWDAINQEDGYYVPADLRDWSAHYMAHRHG
jgi:NAD(P)-dependent dehydrogenase (short-subunit alcohol dehydrogenase family)